jgi:5-methylcytosine-specific restriction endonuclease McrA
MTKRKLNNRNLKEDILKLREKGKSYRDIAFLLNCSKSLISYHCNSGSTKLKVNSYHKNKDTKNKAIMKKLNSFKSRHIPKCITTKTAGFKRTTSRNKTVVNNIKEFNYTTQDVLDKIGSNPKCYLTGKSIDLFKGETYEFDHIIPIKLGGTNDLSNLQITLTEANHAKGQLMLDDFYKLCETILKYRDSKKLKKKSS